MNKLLKSAGAVFAGFFTVVFLSTITDVILEKVGFFPDPTQTPGLFDTKLLLIAFAYRSIYTVIGGYVTSMLSSNPKKDVIRLGIIGTVAGIAGVIGGWDLSQHWYPIALAVFGFPCVWVGGKLQQNK
jgi:hypothetical protein